MSNTPASTVKIGQKNVDPFTGEVVFNAYSTTGGNLNLNGKPSATTAKAGDSKAILKATVNEFLADIKKALDAL